MTQDAILELFQKEKLLARALINFNGYELPSGKMAVDFSKWGTEIEAISRTPYRCTTLLVPGCKVSTYREIGVLMDGNKVEIVHVAEMDAGSCEDRDGSLIAFGPDMGSLEALALKIREECRGLNEVNIKTAPSDAYVGLFAHKASSSVTKATILVAQEYLLQLGRFLPIYIYDSNQGSLTPFNPTMKEKHELMKKHFGSHELALSDTQTVPIFDAAQSEARELFEKDAQCVRPDLCSKISYITYDN